MPYRNRHDLVGIEDIVKDIEVIWVNHASESYRTRFITNIGSNTNMKRVLTFGGAMYDIFIEYEQTQSLQLHLTSGSSSFLVLPEGKKIELKDLSYQ